jgi:hypothetical protein
MEETSTDKLLLIYRLPLLSCPTVLIRAEAAAISGTTCMPIANFFPPGKEDSSLPPAWTQTAQVAAGNLLSDQLYTVVLTSNKNVPEIDVEGPPVLYVLPKHDLLSIGATPSRACMGYGATAAVRHLLSSNDSSQEAAGTDAEDDGLAAVGRSLAQAGAVTVPARFRVDITIGKNYSNSLGEFSNVTVPAAITLNMLSNFTDVSAAHLCMRWQASLITKPLQDAARNCGSSSCVLLMLHAGLRIETTPCGGEGACCPQQS